MSDTITAAQLRAEILRWRDLTQVLGSHRSCECQACRQLRDVADGMGDDDRDEQLDNYCKALEDTNLQLSEENQRLQDAIYERGESPREQRRQIDPVDYLRTRYVSVREYSEGVVSAVETFAKRNS